MDMHDHEKSGIFYWYMGDEGKKNMHINLTMLLEAMMICPSLLMQGSVP